MDTRCTTAAQHGVPDAPFKETWPDLGLKQQMLGDRRRPAREWLGFTSGQTQAARYDLSKQISSCRISIRTAQLGSVSEPRRRTP